METLTGFLTGLLSKIIRPILEEQIQELKKWLDEKYMQAEKFKEFDKEAQALIEQAKNATTKEERDALLNKLNSIRPKL